MENWGTYRQTDGPLQVYNYQERQIETLASFGLDDIPRADALLLFDSHFRAAGYAAEIVMRHEQKYGNKPEFLTCGGHSNKGGFRQRRKNSGRVVRTHVPFMGI